MVSLTGGTIRAFSTNWSHLLSLYSTSSSFDLIFASCLKVTSGALYLPSVLEYGCPPFCLLEEDALKQHEFLDEHGHLIPPWQMFNEIRPGSVVVAVVAIWETNTLCDPPKNGYFERVSSFMNVGVLSLNSARYSVSS